MQRHNNLSIDNFMTVADIARELDVTRQRVHVLLDKYRCDKVRFGGMFLIHVSDFKRIQHERKKLEISRSTT